MKNIKKNEYDLLNMYLHEYMLRQSVRYENDFVQLINNVTYRYADAVDHLEMILAQCRIYTASKIFGDIEKIIALVENR